MAPLFEIFLRDGIWFAILGALAWIAYSRLSAVADKEERWVKALSEPWLLKAALGLAFLSWLWSFGRLFQGDAYLLGAGAFTEISTALLCAILVLAAFAWWRRRPGSRFHPWITLGIVLLLLLSPGRLLLDAPEGGLSQGISGERGAIDFVQKRLAHLGCFQAAGEELEPADATFEALTASATVAFQQANGLVRNPRIDKPGEIRHPEFQRLARPFPFLFGPRPCRRSAGAGG
jgi:hypothetical protein